ncbi:type II toxin-antitoxin system VapC family toxin [Phytohabitans rumicis]|uniref:Ribonuclease VapC n=1 Tax=Phytohabitans rumicis TaxID=1076125 RepID=A0A6V8LDE7_9ACTN|nr:PIN domain-containing protein [Phytohabitans rumicis]GFJ92801.1 ribonuclease VapC [Phytohabitans rumicis]
MTRPVVVVDTGPLVALADRDDADHERCVKWLRLCTSRLVVPSPIVAEVCYLLGGRCGADVEAAFLEALAAREPFEVVAPGPADYLRMAELVRTYADFPLGGSDAAVVALAERLRAVEVATLDRRHFSVVRPRNGVAFVLVPA